MERHSALEREIDGLKAKGREDEEAIAMLRSKVEESRRGVM